MNAPRDRRPRGARARLRRLPRRGAAGRRARRAARRRRAGGSTSARLSRAGDGPRRARARGARAGGVLAPAWRACSALALLPLPLVLAVDAVLLGCALRAAAALAADAASPTYLVVSYARAAAGRLIGARLRRRFRCCWRAPRRLHRSARRLRRDA